jgi:hypothetical protein
MGRRQMRRPIIRRPVPEHAGSHLKKSFDVRLGSLLDVVGIRSTDVLGNSTPDNFLFARQSCRTLLQEHIRESATSMPDGPAKSGVC